VKKYLRPIFYIVVMLVTIIAIQKRKSESISEKTSTPISVLGILQSQGAPVDIYKVEPKDMMEYMRKTLDKCDSTFCFFLSSEERKNITVGDPVYNDSGSKLIGNISAVAGNDMASGLSKDLIKQKSVIHK
jgi:hypothetical protein